jgi:hypothetical protein
MLRCYQTLCLYHRPTCCSLNGYKNACIAELRKQAPESADMISIPTMFHCTKIVLN